MPGMLLKWLYGAQEHHYTGQREEKKFSILYLRIFVTFFAKILFFLTF